ncbi:MAG: methionine adenosyltransferase domain-containing protein [Spirochaetales bacterium]|nr:methionine adenosyltransferase domain-containing protein [Spirochaetales bacterium]
MILFSTEMVSKYHPDKYADQISDSVLTEILKRDPSAHVACECMAKDNTVVLAGEVTAACDIDYEAVVRSVAARLGYKVDKVINLITKQSTEIGNAVDAEEQIGAGDQGMMFGFAVNGGKYYLPYGQEVAIDIIKAIEGDIEKNPDSIFLGDAKTQVTTDISASGFVKPVDTILVSACHKEGLSIDQVRKYVCDLLSANGIPVPKKLLINPAGTWTFGGPAADCGLTGRKIVCDQYGGYAPVGGGAFSGKDPSKVDRSGCYAARKIAVDLVRKHNFDSCVVQLAYAIGVSNPVSVSAIGTLYDGSKADVSDEVLQSYDMTPRGIIRSLNLLELDYGILAGGNHMMAFI